MRIIIYIALGAILGAASLWGLRTIQTEKAPQQTSTPTPQDAMTDADDPWFESPFGKDDTLGALNYITPEKVKQAAALVREGKIYQLAVTTGRDTPAYPPRKFNLVVHQLSDGTGTALGANKAVSNDDTIMTALGIGSQIDGLGHFGRDHIYYNRTKAADVVTPSGLKKFGMETLPGIVTRGILLDMTTHYGQNPLPIGTAFGEEDIKAAAKAQGVSIEKGDVVLFHTGYMEANKGSTELVMGEPGLGVSGANYLSELGVVAIGADTWALEALPGEDATELFPVHQILLTKYGVYILENMVTKPLADDKIYEFMFALGVPKLEGAVQAIINPLAIR